MTAKRGRPGIKPHVKNLILAKALQNKDTPRLALAVELKNLIEEMSEVPPSEETMLRLISRARNHPKSPLDEPWHVATLAVYDMPAEALPVVLMIWAKSQEKPDEPLTIREAKWVARLYRLVNNIEFLYVYAKHYASEEKTAEIIGGLPPFGANAFFDAWWVQRPALEPLLFRWGRGLPDLEMIAASIFMRPFGGPAEAYKDEGIKMAIKEHRGMMADVVKEAGLPRPFLDGILGALKKEAQHERPHTAKR